jgi:ABC-2 type transport system ATP-binding protein
MWEYIESLVADGTTILLTTQYLDEADRLAHRIVVIDYGKVIAEGTSRTGAGVRTTEFMDSIADAGALRSRGGPYRRLPAQIGHEKEQAQL